LPDPQDEPDFLRFSDKLVNWIFKDEAILKRMGTSHESLSNHLTALVCSKPLTSYLEEMQANMPKFTQKHDQTLVSRLLTIQKLVPIARDLLYKYNKEKL
jgi:hypothetical protein